MNNRETARFRQMIVILIASAPFLAPADEPATTSKEEPITVTVQPATTRSVERRVAIVGSLYGREEIPVSSEVGGRIIRIHHEVGETVRPGDLLFEIDPREYELSANEARRALEWELAKLGLKTPPETDDAVPIDKLPMVQRAASQLALAEQVHRRANQLRTQKTISQDEWDKAEAELKLNQAAHEQALLDARASLAAIRQKQAILETALERLADTKVTVPSPSITPGDRPLQMVVSDRTVTEGEIVGGTRSADPSFRLVIVDPLKLEAAVAERYAVEIKKGQKAKLQTEATGSDVFEGEVVRVHPTVDRASRTFRVEIEINNEKRLLPPGAFAKASIYTRTDPHALTVPAEAIVRFAGVVKVFVVRNGLSQGVLVKVGQRIDVASEGKSFVWLEVSGDLSPGEPVVVTGQRQLADGTPVRVRESTPLAATASRSSSASKEPALAEQTP